MKMSVILSLCSFIMAGQCIASYWLAKKNDEVQYIRIDFTLLSICVGLIFMIKVIFTPVRVNA